MKSAEALIASPKAVVRKFPDWLSQLDPRLFLNPDRKLISSVDIEIENAYKIDLRLREYLENYFKGGKFKTSTSTANSLYLDTLDLDLLLKSLLSFRDRAGGMASDGTTYQDTYGIKYKDQELQSVVDDVIHQIYPHLAKDYSSEDLWSFAPNVRSEIERAHAHPHDASELTLDLLPEDLKNIIVLAIGEEKANELVLKPAVNTIVERTKYMVYLDACGFVKKEGAAAEGPRFEDFPIYAAPTKDMKETGLYVCLELAFDDIQNQKPRKGSLISDLLTDLDTNKKSVCERKIKFARMEYEYVGEKSGANLTDEVFVDVYTRFGLSIKKTDREIKGDFKSEAGKLKPPWIDMKMAVSKAAAAAHALDRRCSGKRRLGKKYKKIKHALP